MSNSKYLFEYLFNISPTERGKVFELYSKWFLENDPTYSAQLKKVWLWKDWPNNWGRDKGIDLIAETHTGEFWAIQAKCYDENYYVTKEDVDKFLSESSRKVISYRLLICTTDRLGNNAREVIAAQEKQVGICSLEHLLDSSLQWPTSIEHLQPQLVRKLKTPRPHQEKAISSILEGFESHDRGQLHMACGTGKTLVGLWIAEALKSQNTLVLVPSISLVSQLYQEWVANATTNFIPIFVCSDSTVGDNDQMVTSLYELGFPTTTNPQAIQNYFSSSIGIPKVIFSTYHSSPVIKELCALNKHLTFDITIADEAHRCTGTANSEFATIFETNGIRTCRKLFMTATPKIFSDHVKTKAQEFEHCILSMDDEEKFGPVFHKLSFSAAISQDLLSDYEVLISVMDNTTYREYAEKGRFVSIGHYEHETDARTVASQILISKIIKKYNLQRLITFHSKKSGASDFVNTFPRTLQLIPINERPNIGFYGTIFGEMQQTKRKSVMQLFKEIELGKSGILANVRCLSEGVDVPTLNGVAFIDPKGSQIDIIQAVGRAIRKAPNKQIGHIIIPIFIDDNEDATSNLEQSCFKPIWKVLNALRAHDDILVEELDHLRLELGRRLYRQPPKLGKITIDLPVSIGVEFSDSLKLKIVDRCSTNWEFYYGLLLRYIEKFGKAPTNTKIQYEGYNLGSWISNQRKSYNNKELNNAYIKRLEFLSGWAWDALEAYWMQGFELLKSFLQKNGHLNLPFNHCIGDFNLSSWTSVQRRAFKNQKMSSERQEKLESLPFWYWDYNDSRKIQGQNALRAYFERENHFRVPTTHKENNFPLGIWLKQKKDLYHKRELLDDEVLFFESFPEWSWQSINEQIWEYGYSILEKFVKIYGHARPTSSFKMDEFGLGTWVKTQRDGYSKKALCKEKINKLVSFPGWSWIVFDDKNNEGFNALDSFVKREGHALVPTEHIENGFKLGKWIALKRLAANNTHSKHKLTEEHRKKLESYPGWFWDGMQGRWERGKQLLINFCAREGHARVVNSHIEDGFELGRWIGIWRYEYNKNTLPQEKIEFFESLPKWSWDVKTDRWYEGFNILKKYVYREGHANVSAKHMEGDFTLGIWVRNQKYSYTKQSYGKKLSQEKIKLLESLPGWTWLSPRSS